MIEGGPQSPILILGLTRRSGTNFLWSLLAQHPALATRDGIPEDFLLHHASRLDDYAATVAAEWEVELRGQERASLLEHLGRGLVSFLEADGARHGRRVVTKTPSIRNLQLASALFPTSPVLVLVRDGRSVVESAVRSFGVSHAAAAEEWAAAARDLLRCLARVRGPAQCLVVRYEDLLTELHAELLRIFDFCGLDADDYDFDAARVTPVMGSSTDRGGATELHWRPVPRPRDFAGLRRWDGWSEQQHRRFNAIAGEELGRLGYEVESAR